MISPQIGIYIHIPYCLQKCPYCDFAKYEIHEIPPYAEYTQLLKKEISFKAPLLQNKSVKTLYLGGGTPSLLPPSEILSLRQHLEQYFDFSGLEEFTIECNPGTITHSSLEELQKIGVNRLSVGAQTFQADILKRLGRKHSVQETFDLLEIARSSGINFTLDLMYALPGQTVEGFQKDIQTALSFNPPHISLYYLTLPQHHALNIDRPDEDAQVEMFESLEKNLLASGIHRYEISNFSKPGFESRHNSLYWSDAEYIGFGLSSHSYLKNSIYGTRFWNFRTFEKYKHYVENYLSSEEKSIFTGLPEKNIEALKLHEALTDFCHTSLRRMKGLCTKESIKKFHAASQLLTPILKKLHSDGLLDPTNEGYKLSSQGKRLTNLVFEKLTFLEGDVAHHGG